ncbi:MAG: hypothetical protein KDD62_00550 [Bdellovibrionales bacterium]|nr:hypothetical protein [Bdellovibrionales bacterium]
MLKKIICIVVVMLGVASFASAQPVIVGGGGGGGGGGLSCEAAIGGTCGHFGIGDGSGYPQFEIENWTMAIDMTWQTCEVTATNLDPEVTCTFDSRNCPETATEDGPDEPGVVWCSGCSELGPFSINEAKCCLIRGEPSGPLGEIVCTHEMG